jgi:hypothetical protein
MCTRFNRDLLISVGTSTSILHNFSSCGGYWLWSFFGSFRYLYYFSIGVPCVVFVSELFAVRYRTAFTMNALSGLCHIRYCVFPGKTPAFVLTAQRVANPALYLYVYCVPYNLFTSVLRFHNDQFRTQLVVYISFRRRSVSDLAS